VLLFKVIFAASNPLPSAPVEHSKNANRVIGLHQHFQRHNLLMGLFAWFITIVDIDDIDAIEASVKSLTVGWFSM